MAARHPPLTRAAPRLAPLVCLCLCAMTTAGVRQDAGPPSRIVSIVPAATEMLFAVGAGPQVVGVSSFDTFPPEVASRTRVGGLVDPDLEAILALRPELVVVYATQHDLIAQLSRARIPTFPYEHGGLEDVLATVRSIAGRVGHPAEADRLVRRLRARLDGVRRRVAGRPRPRTLLVIDRDRGSLRNIVASGGEGFLHDMLEVAGGENAFADVRRPAVPARSELILARAPEVIVELRGSAATISPDEWRTERHLWDRLGSVPAVRSDRIILLPDQSLVVAGPRIAEGTERLARALHPEAYQQAPSP